MEPNAGIKRINTVFVHYSIVHSQTSEEQDSCHWQILLVINPNYVIGMVVISTYENERTLGQYCRPGKLTLCGPLHGGAQNIATNAEAQKGPTDPAPHCDFLF